MPWICRWRCLLLVWLLLVLGAAALPDVRPARAEPWNPRQLARIEAAAANPLRFAVLGDSRNGDEVFTGILLDLNRTPGLAFAVHLGDTVPDGAPAHFEHFFRLVEPLRLPLLTVLGNHELRGQGASARCQELFGPPYFAFHVGPHAFFILDNSTSRAMDEAQLRWLERELSHAAAAATRLVFLHKPLFDPRQSKNHASDRETAKTLLALCQRHRVTHVFAAHIHGYFTGQWDGVPFTISGGAGAPLHHGDPAWAFYHYLTVTLTGDRVEVQVHRVAGPPKVVPKEGVVAD